MKLRGWRGLCFFYALASGMDAHFTNAITNGLHATCLLIYLAAALRARLRGNPRFTEIVVGFFLLTFCLKVMGVFVHYAPESDGVRETWIGIGAGVVLLNYLILQALRFPVSFRVGGLLFSLGCTALVAASGRFNFIAVEIAVINLAAALYCRGLMRVGFAGVVIANIAWLVAREGTGAWLGHEVPSEWRYDNDLYHFMLIASTFLIFKAFARGDGLPDAFAADPVSEEAEPA